MLDPSAAKRPKERRSVGMPVAQRLQPVDLSLAALPLGVEQRRLADSAKLVPRLRDPMHLVRPIGLLGQRPWNEVRRESEQAASIAKAKPHAHRKSRYRVRIDSLIATLRWC